MFFASTQAGYVQVQYRIYTGTGRIYTSTFTVQDIYRYSTEYIQAQAGYIQVQYRIYSGTGRINTGTVQNMYRYGTDIYR